MTDQLPPEDQELAERVRRSMAHYRFSRPMTDVPRPRSRVVWLASLAGAAAVGAAVSLAVIAGLNLVPRVSNPGNEPTPTPIVQPDPSATPVPVLDVTEAQAAAECLQVEPADVINQWLEPGETKADVVARFATLPLLIVDRREEWVMFVFADDRLVTGCRFIAAHEQPETIVRSVRTVLGNRPARALYIGSQPMTIDENGDMVPNGEPDITAVGVAQPNVARVAIVLEDGRTLDARLGAGMWFAWWNDPVSGVAIRTYDQDGRLIAETPEEFTVMRFPEDGVEFPPPSDASSTP